MNKIIVLVDYNEQFYCPHKRTSVTTDLNKTANLFSQSGYLQEIKHFEEIDFRNDDYKDIPILYQSSQDRGLFYKNYIEDIILGLQLQGARLIPDFLKFRAHHNKLFQEVMRSIGLFGDEASQLKSFCFSTYETFSKYADSLPYPVVIKASSGDTGTNVRLARNKKEALKIAEKLSRSFMVEDFLDNLFLRFSKKGHKPQSTHRGKIIAQEFVPGLDRDYKILAFGDRYFVDLRMVRPGDFRASGSKQPRVWPKSFPTEILDFTERIFKKCRTPYASIDVLFDGKQVYLSEIQFLRFGTKPLINAPHYWRRNQDAWQVVEERCNWEEELVRTIILHLDSERDKDRH